MKTSFLLCTTAFNKTASAPRRFGRLGRRAVTSIEYAIMSAAVVIPLSAALAHFYYSAPAGQPAAKINAALTPYVTAATPTAPAAVIPAGTGQTTQGGDGSQIVATSYQPPPTIFDVPYMPPPVVAAAPGVVPPSQPIVVVDHQGSYTAALPIAQYVTAVTTIVSDSTQSVAASIANGTLQAGEAQYNHGFLVSWSFLAPAADAPALDSECHAGQTPEAVAQSEQTQPGGLQNFIGETPTQVAVNDLGYDPNNPLDPATVSIGGVSTPISNAGSAAASLQYDPRTQNLMSLNQTVANSSPVVLESMSFNEPGFSWSAVAAPGGTAYWNPAAKAAGAIGSEVVVSCLRAGNSGSGGGNLVAAPGSDPAPLTLADQQIADMNAQAAATTQFANNAGDNETIATGLFNSSAYPYSESLKASDLSSYTARLATDLQSTYALYPSAFLYQQPGLQSDIAYDSSAAASDASAVAAYTADAAAAAAAALADENAGQTADASAESASSTHLLSIAAGYKLLETSSENFVTAAQQAELKWAQGFVAANAINPLQTMTALAPLLVKRFGLAEAAARTVGGADYRLYVLQTYFSVDSAQASVLQTLITQQNAGLVQLNAAIKALGG